MKWKYGLIKQDGLYEIVQHNEFCAWHSLDICEESYEWVMDTLRIILKDLEDPIVIYKDGE